MQILGCGWEIEEGGIQEWAFLVIIKKLSSG
jgi:hypothetical protein